MSSNNPSTKQTLLNGDYQQDVFYNTLHNKSIYLCSDEIRCTEEVRMVEKIILSLASFAFVHSPHTCSTEVGEMISNSNNNNSSGAIISADVFVFILSDNQLKTKSSLRQLGLAISYSVPLVLVRHTSFVVPESLSGICYQTEICRRKLLRGNEKITTMADVINQNRNDVLNLSEWTFAVC